MHAQWPCQALSEKQSQAELGLHQRASSYTTIYPIACHFYLSMYRWERLRQAEQLAKMAEATTLNIIFS